MILPNNDYVSNASYNKEVLARAVEQNSLLLTQDQSRWFYKRWRGLTVNTGDMDKLETKLGEHLKREKRRYRVKYEEGICPYPSGVLFASYKAELDKEDNKIMAAFRRLPKCGLLHVHSAAALSAEGLIELLKNWNGPTIYIYANTEDSKQGKMVYDYPEEEQSDIKPLKTFIEDGGEVLLKKWLTIGEHTKDEKYIWNEFNRIFIRTSCLFANRAFYYEYHYRFFLECLRDRIDYVELRCGFQNFTDDKNGEENVILDQSPNFLDELMRAKDAAKAEYLRTKKEEEWKLPYGEFNLGVILCARRDKDAQKGEDKTALMKKVDTAIVWKLGKYGKLIKGFDFVSEEDRGKASYTYYQDIFYGDALDGYVKNSKEDIAFKALKDQYKITNLSRLDLIELMLHAGESLWIEQENILDAKIASKSRIGHGFQLLAYPGVLWEYMSEPYDGMPRGPVLEVCPISNQMLRYFPDIRNHYALILMKMGVPCVLANDDPQILGNPGLSYDFWEIYMASDGGVMLIKGLVFTAFIFQYQDRIDKQLDQWAMDDYRKCLQEFAEKYWMPYLKEMDSIIDA